SRHVLFLLPFLELGRIPMGNRSLRCTLSLAPHSISGDRERFRLVERLFHLKENQTTVRRELLAGLTTFMTMAYVVIVNPQILSESGMPVDGVLFATRISSAVATAAMGLWANYPIALAPGMSLNAYFTSSIVLGRGVPWPAPLGERFLPAALVVLLAMRWSAGWWASAPPAFRSGSVRVPLAASLCRSPRVLFCDSIWVRPLSLGPER